MYLDYFQTCCRVVAQHLSIRKSALIIYPVVYSTTQGLFNARRFQKCFGLRLNSSKNGHTKHQALLK